MTPARVTAPPSAVPADFGDWLPSMAVKELRQGLRTSRFVAAFAILQSLLVMTLLITNSVASAEATTSLFWGIVALVLVIVLPSRAFTALPGEIKPDSLGLLSLTGISGLRITAGIWLGLVAQSLLTAVTILPYVIMRYFAGGVDVTAELTTLLVLVMLSALVTAMAVTASTVPSIILRLLLALVIAALAFRALGEVYEWLDMQGTFLALFRLSTPFPLENAQWCALIAGYWAFLCYFILDMGGSALAPWAHHGASRKRLVVLAAVSCLFLLGELSVSREDAVSTAILILLGLASIDCLTESPVARDFSVFTPFLRYGRMGRWAAHVLAPGWATGILFYLVLMLLIAAGTAGANQLLFGGNRLLVYAGEHWLQLANILLIPPSVLGLALLTFRKSDRVLLPCLIWGFALAVLAGVFGILADEIGDFKILEALGKLSGLTPATALAFVENLHSYRIPIGLEPFVLSCGLASGTAALVYVMIRSFPHHRRLTNTLAAAAELAPDPISREPTPV